MRVLIEDDWFVGNSYAVPGNVHLLSTASFLDGREKADLIPLRRRSEDASNSSVRKCQNGLQTWHSAKRQRNDKILGSKVQNAENLVTLKKIFWDSRAVWNSA